ncbi:hypothetical protein TIFTF001_007377 [Ficus carica]|uniref:Uncharacterized protein n=1 Tax=Ficus carica TaxID=3494 RepID=A0AA88A2V4_FICCA|nr:hypothetical protein TIFTF001_007377 [Ficus carica]
MTAWGGHGRSIWADLEDIPPSDLEPVDGEVAGLPKPLPSAGSVWVSDARNHRRAPLTSEILAICNLRSAASSPDLNSRNPSNPPGNNHTP